MSELNIRDKIHIYLLKNGANKKTIKDLYELDGLIKYSSKKVREWGLSDIKEPTEEQLNQFTPEEIALIKKQQKNIDDEKDLILSKIKIINPDEFEFNNLNDYNGCLFFNIKTNKINIIIDNKIKPL
jgi:hypothetical protein